MLRVGIIGAGTVGIALAARLNTRGYRVRAVYSRSLSSAQKLAVAVGECQVFHNSQDVADNADLVFLTTPDNAIGEVASTVKWHTGQSVVHCSGADSTDILQPAREAGAHVGSFHPLQTFAGIQQAIENIPGSTFAIEAEEPLFAILKEMATALGGYWIELKAEEKVAYHAAAAIACNYLVTLVKSATDLWQSFGADAEQATRALMPLLKGTLHNIETVGIPQCLTGPIARGDTGTVRKHLAALQKVTPGLIPSYCELGLQTIPVAVAKGRITQQQADEIKDMLEECRSRILIEV